MADFDSLPSSISHKTLSTFLSTAKAQNDSTLSDLSKQSSELEDFEVLLKKWHSISQEILNVLKNKPRSVMDDRSTESLMALGAMEAHLTMAIHAHKSSETTD